MHAARRAARPPLTPALQYECYKAGTCPLATMRETLMPLLWFEVAADMTTEETGAARR